METRLGIPQPLRTAVAVLLLPLHLASCTAWRVQPQPAQAVVPRAPEKARFTLTDSTRLILLRPWISADSVRGENEATGQSVGVPLARVSRIEIRKPSEGRTLGLIIAIPIGILVLTAVLCASGNWTCGDPS